MAPLGRDAELQVVDEFIAQALERPAALLLEGEAGIGKTTLWREAVERAEGAGLRVLSARPAETEAKLAYAGLRDLLEPLPEEAFEPLPAIQRDAIDLALFRAGTGEARAEPLAVAAATRTVLAHAALDEPLLIAVDDAQWLDAASSAALTYAARRFADERIGVLVTRRPQEPGRRGRFELPEARAIRLGQLSVGALHTILKDRLELSLQRPLLLRLHAACAGNPFHALEVARELKGARLAPGEPFPVPDDLRQLLRRRMARLSQPAREALLVAAAVGEPRRSLLETVLEDDPVAALDESEAAGVVSVEGEAVRFTHPLYAAAIYAAAPHATRVRIHRRLADAVVDAEERARHLAIAADEPSTALATELEQAAGAARSRGGALAAAELLVESARLTPPADRDLAHRRELGAAQAFFDGAEGAAAREILEGLREAMARSSDRARVHLLLAVIHSYDGEHEAAKNACLAALADAHDDPLLLAEAHLRFALVCYDDVDAARQSAARARELVEGDPDAPTDLVAAALLDDAYEGLYMGEGLAAPQVERAMTLVPSYGSTWPAQRAQVVAYLYAKYTDDLVRARELLVRLIELRRNEGHDYEAALTLRHLAEVECWLGNWQRAAEVAAEADDAATDRTVTLYNRALVAAHLGEAAAAREAAETGLGLAGDNPWYRALNLSVLGFLELSLGDAAAAVERLEDTAADVARTGMGEPVRFRFEGDYVEALVALGRIADAAEVVEQLGRRSVATPRPWTCAVHARGLALVEAASGDLEAAAAAIDAALRAHERLPMPFERARTLLVKGEIERRGKQRGAAKASLEDALAEFERLGAQLWAQRARNELERVGLRRTAAELTQNERRVAELAASGMTNREVASRLFLSPKTVEANLARAYRKLGIRSRAELGARFPGQT